MSRLSPIDLTGDESPDDVTFLRVVPAPAMQPTNLMADFNAVAAAPPAQETVAPLVPIMVNGELRMTVPVVNADPPPDFDMDVENLDDEIVPAAVALSPAQSTTAALRESFDSDDEMLFECLLALSSP